MAASRSLSYSKRKTCRSSPTLMQVLDSFKKIGINDRVVHFTCPKCQRPETHAIHMLRPPDHPARRHKVFERAWVYFQDCSFLFAKPGTWQIAASDLRHRPYPQQSDRPWRAQTGIAMMRYRTTCSFSADWRREWGIRMCPVRPSMSPIP